MFLDEFTQNSEMNSNSNQAGGSVGNEFNRKNLDLGLKLELLFAQGFTRWGKFVATYPIQIIIVSLTISVLLSCGLFFATVTTDPIDLWVASGSQARQDMEFFNEKFWKFYRLEQLILTPTDQTFFNASVTLKDSAPKNFTFGPAFRQQFMIDAFNLQQTIENLTAVDGDRTIHFEDICFKPLGNSCATQTIFTYYIDGVKELNDTNYLSKIITCPK